MRLNLTKHQRYMLVDAIRNMTGGGGGLVLARPWSVVRRTAEALVRKGLMERESDGYYFRLSDKGRPIAQRYYDDLYPDDTAY